MLAREHRLTSGSGFARAVRKGGRAATRRLVVHLSPSGDALAAAGDSARVGLVVSKAVGNAVVRNRVKRRLRHLVAARLSTLPDGSVLVVRALPPAAKASSFELGGDLDSALGRLVGRAS